MEEPTLPWPDRISKPANGTGRRITARAEACCGRPVGAFDCVGIKLDLTRVAEGDSSKKHEHCSQPISGRQDNFRSPYRKSDSVSRGITPQADSEPERHIGGNVGSFCPDGKLEGPPERAGSFRPPVSASYCGCSTSSTNTLPPLSAVTILCTGAYPLSVMSIT
jgi:hypothetical protein